jgi:elongation factor G
LHLNIYVERLRREFNVECVTGNPTVNYKETIASKGEFNYLHKKQSGGAGQYARVIGFVEPMEESEMKNGLEYEFENRCTGTNIPPEFYPSCAKGAATACTTGALGGFPLTGVRVVLLDGQSHIVDSNDMAFQLAMRYGIREAVNKAKPQILEPIMTLEVNCPAEFQGVVIGGISKRNGLIESSELSDDGSQLMVRAEIALAELFGYSTDLRSSTQGKGEFTMEYKAHKPVSKATQLDLAAKFQERLKKEQDA